jgi:hypothetical protein
MKILSQLMENFKPGLLLYAEEKRKQKEFQKETKVDVLDVQAVGARDLIDEKMGYARFVEGGCRLGWLVTITETLLEDGSCADGRSGVDLYFFQDDGETFKATLLYDPYILLICKDEQEPEVETFLKRKFPKYLVSTQILEKEDLDMVRLSLQSLTT